MVRLQDDFMITSMGHGLRQLLSLMTNRQLVVLWTWSKISKTWCWILPENGNEGEELPEDSILQTLSNTTKWWQILMHGKQLVWLQPCPLINEIKALSSFEDYTSKLGTYELAGKPNLMPFSVSPDFMNAQMNVLWGEALSLIFAWYDLLWRRQWKRPRVIGCLASNGWKALGKIWFLRGRNQRYPG